MNNEIWHAPHLVALTAGSQAQNSPAGSYTDGATKSSTLTPTS